MKFKVSKKSPHANKHIKPKGQKFFIGFEESKRLDYVTGFQKRKKERQERAKKFNEARIKKQLLIARTERRKRLKEILADHERNTKEAEDDFSEDSDSDDATPHAYENKVGTAEVSDTVVTTCAGATVEISTLGLNSDHHLGSNVDFKSCQLEGSTLARHKGLLKLCGSKSQSQKKNEESQSFSDMVRGVMKKAQKKAKKAEKERAFMSKEDKSIKPLKQRKKIQVTEL
ncbi:Nucleolar protein 12 [Trinorchestia longiramus]|nr:Nucleolar protein 12 [Trinorchestia longiramus]